MGDSDNTLNYENIFMPICLPPKKLKMKKKDHLKGNMLVSQYHQKIIRENSCANNWIEKRQKYNRVVSVSV